MKDPNYIKFEDNQFQSKKYNFFDEGLFPERADEKKYKNKSSQKKQQKLPLSLPNEINKKKAPNTQNDNYIPFFAKDYPSSSESKEDICFINSPMPSNSAGEAEEVEGAEEEGETQRNKDLGGLENGNEKKYDINNEEMGLSIDYNSEIEAEQERPSSMMSRTEVIERFKLQEEKKREEKRKKEEEEKKKEEKRRTKEEKKKKEEEEKRKKEMEKKKKEDGKKSKEIQRKNNPTNKKEEGFNLLSTIKKMDDDNSYAISNSIINDVKQIFPGIIPEENSDEEDDYSKKNFRKNSKGKQESIRKESQRKKSKSIKISNFKEDIMKEQRKESKKKSKEKKEEKEVKITKKSNGLSIKEAKKFNDNEDEEFSNYGDELIDVEPDSQDGDEKVDSDGATTKAKVKRKNSRKKSKPKKMKNGKSQYPISSEDLRAYMKIIDSEQYLKLKVYDIRKLEEKKEKRYSQRNRIPALRHDLGEKAHYVYTKDGPELASIDLVNTRGYDSILKKNNNNKKKRKLKKGKGIIEDDSDSSEKNQIEKIVEEDEYNSELLDSQNFSEFGEDDARFIKIPKGGKKGAARNYDTILVIKVHEAQGKNMIKVDNEEYKDLRSGEIVKVKKNQIYEILNFSDYQLVVQLLFDIEN